MYKHVAHHRRDDHPSSISLVSCDLTVCDLSNKLDQHQGETVWWGGSSSPHRPLPLRCVEATGRLPMAGRYGGLSAFPTQPESVYAWLEAINLTHLKETFAAFTFEHLLEMGSVELEAYVPSKGQRRRIMLALQQLDIEGLGKSKLRIRRDQISMSQEAPQVQAPLSGMHSPSHLRPWSSMRKPGYDFGSQSTIPGSSTDASQCSASFSCVANSDSRGSHADSPAAARAASGRTGSLPEDLSLHSVLLGGGTAIGSSLQRVVEISERSERSEPSERQEPNERSADSATLATEIRSDVQVGDAQVGDERGGGGEGGERPVARREGAELRWVRERRPPTRDPRECVSATF